MFSLPLISMFLTLVLASTDSDIESGAQDTVYVSVVVSVISVVTAIFGALFCGIIGVVLWKCRKKRRTVHDGEDVVPEGGLHQNHLTLSLREPFVRTYAHLPPRAYRVGFWTYTPEQKRVQLLDTMFLFRNKAIIPPVDAERKFSDIFYNLRCGKYTAYSHCKFCYLEQREFYKKYGQTVCVKCGLPTVLYLDFEADDRFCVVCALMNKYHPRPHIRCLLHTSGKGKRLGAMYVLYKEYYSISSASKPKKRTARAQKLSSMLEPHVWKLNSAIRFEFLWLVRRLIRLDIHDPSMFEESMLALEETKRETHRRLSEIGPNMPLNYSEHGLDLCLNDGSVSEVRLRMFYSCLRELLNHLLSQLQLNISYLMMQRGAQQHDVGMMQVDEVVDSPETRLVGRKRGRTRRERSYEDDEESDLATDDERGGVRVNRNKRRRTTTDGTYVALNVNINVSASSPQPSEESAPSVTSTASGSVQMHPVDIQVNFGPPPPLGTVPLPPPPPSGLYVQNPGPLIYPHHHHHHHHHHPQSASFLAAFPPPHPVPPAHLMPLPPPPPQPALPDCSRLFDQAPPMMRTGPAMAATGPRRRLSEDLQILGMEDEYLVGMDEDIDKLSESGTSCRTSPSRGVEDDMTPGSPRWVEHQIQERRRVSLLTAYNDQQQQQQMQHHYGGHPRVPPPPPPPPPHSHLQPTMVMLGETPSRSPLDSLTSTTTDASSIGFRSDMTSLSLGMLSGTHSQSSSVRSGVIDFSNSFQRDQILMDGELFQSRGVILGEQDLPKYDVDEYVQTFNADASTVDGLVESAIDSFPSMVMASDSPVPRKPKKAKARL